jgi:hypothetical protein
MLKTKTQEQNNTLLSPTADDTHGTSYADQCGHGMLAGVKTTEIPPEKVAGSNGSVWYEEPGDDEPGGWYIHFSAVNRASGYCIPAIEYEVELESDNGSILKGHGKKHLPPLSPNYSYSPPARVSDDRVHFLTKTKQGALKSWTITKVYWFPISGS